MYRMGLGISTATAVAVLTLVLSGCDNGPDLVPVSGKVQIDGKPLTYGAVLLIPSTGRPAYGRVDSEGRFKLVTDEADGVVAGTHAVEVAAVEAISEYENKYHAPAKYGSATTSGLTATISEPTDDLTFELTWDGQRPPG